MNTPQITDLHRQHSRLVSALQPAVVTEIGTLAQQTQARPGATPALARELATHVLMGALLALGKSQDTAADAQLARAGARYLLSGPWHPQPQSEPQGERQQPEPGLGWNGDEGSSGTRMPGTEARGRIQAWLRYAQDEESARTPAGPDRLTPQQIMQAAWSGAVLALGNTRTPRAWTAVLELSELPGNHPSAAEGIGQVSSADSSTADRPVTSSPVTGKEGWPINRAAAQANQIIADNPAIEREITHLARSLRQQMIREGRPVGTDTRNRLHAMALIVLGSVIDTHDLRLLSGEERTSLAQQITQGAWDRSEPTASELAQAELAQARPATAQMAAAEARPTRAPVSQHTEPSERSWKEEQTGPLRRPDAAQQVRIQRLISQSNEMSRASNAPDNGLTRWAAHMFNHLRAAGCVLSLGNPRSPEAYALVREITQGTPGEPPTGKQAAHHTAQSTEHNTPDPALGAGAHAQTGAHDRDITRARLILTANPAVQRELNHHARTLRQQMNPGISQSRARWHLGTMALLITQSVTSAHGVDLLSNTDHLELAEAMARIAWTEAGRKERALEWLNHTEQTRTDQTRTGTLWNEAEIRRIWSEPQTAATIRPGPMNEAAARQQIASFLKDVGDQGTYFADPAGAADLARHLWAAGMVLSCGNARSHKAYSLVRDLRERLNRHDQQPPSDTAAGSQQSENSESHRGPAAQQIDRILADNPLVMEELAHHAQLIRTRRRRSARCSKDST